jgi:hypothetical protein
MRHVEAIAREPHPLGSIAAERVRAYVVAELRDLGLEPQIQQPRDTRAVEPAAELTPSSLDVRNVVARWRGIGLPEKKALLLSAHYDSVPAGPGAGDNASGVAAILEALRALKAGSPLERDVIILIDDGEEVGLFGADLFAREHPWANDVGVVLNLDARGHTGPSYMFETSEGNGWLIEQLAHALPHPMATSLTMEVYRLLPNDTDLTIYKRHGMAGLNFAFVGGLSYYHSPEDTPANLDPRTLQHQGENVLAMARHLGRLDLDDIRRGNVIYSSVLGRLVVGYPVTWVVPLMGCAALAFIVGTLLGVSHGRVRLVDIAAGFVAFLLAVIAGVLTVWGLWHVLRDFLARLEVPVLRYDLVILMGFAGVALLIGGVVFAWSSRRWSSEGLGLGVLSWWLVETVATSIWLPGASHVFLWPLLAIAAGQAVSFLVPRGSAAALLASAVAAVPLLVLHAPILPGLFEGLNLRMATPLMIPVLLVAGALVPLASQIWIPGLKPPT